MIISEHAQGTDEWMAERVGRASASNADKMFTTALKVSTQRVGYMNSLLGEWMLGEKEQIKQTDWMTRGIELEAEARSAYEFINELSVTEVGFIFKDERMLAGCSVDGLVEGGQGQLEIKCPMAKTHIGYLLGQKLPSSYFAQVHFQLYTTGREYCDFISYHPGLPTFEVRVEREQATMDKIDELTEAFLSEMLEKRAKLESL
jgi:hypothetical protein